MNLCLLSAVVSCSLVATTLACGGLLVGNGAFTSPNYPGLYPASQSCTWTLKATEDKAVRLQFTDFELETGLECSYDYVKIYNGQVTTANLVRTACGINYPVEYTGRGLVTVVFVSDGAVHKKGFSAAFESVDSSVVVPPPTTKPTNGSGCGANYESSTGTVASPNYPNLYPNLANCIYTITVPNHRAVLTFQAVNIESHSTCDYDYLEIRDGHATGKVLGKICGTSIPGRIISSNSTLHLRFVSDSSLQKSGFIASWHELTCASKGGICVSACDGSADSSLPCPTTGDVCCFPKIQDGDCGLVPASRIVGGNESTSHSWPWQASLQQISNGYGYHICGASILTSRWIVTAAHCVEGSSPDRLQVVVGEHDFRTPNQEQIMRIQKIIKHEGYHGNNDDGFPNDIALLKLTAPILFNRYVQPVCLPRYLQEFVLENCWITGWGDTKETGDDNLLNQLPVEVLTREDCRNKWSAKYINDGHICIGNGVKGACNGDSGGPLQCLMTLEDRTRWVLAGATSFGIRGCQTEGFPNVYTRISYFLPWIEGTIRENMYRST